MNLTPVSGSANAKDPPAPGVPNAEYLTSRIPTSDVGLLKPSEYDCVRLAHEVAYVLAGCHGRRLQRLPARAVLKPSSGPPVSGRAVHFGERPRGAGAVARRYLKRPNLVALLVSTSFVAIGEGNGLRVDSPKGLTKAITRRSGIENACLAAVAFDGAGADRRPPGTTDVGRQTDVEVQLEGPAISSAMNRETVRACAPSAESSDAYQPRVSAVTMPGPGDHSGAWAASFADIAAGSFCGVGNYCQRRLDDYQSGLVRKQLAHSDGTLAGLCEFRQ